MKEIFTKWLFNRGCEIVYFGDKSKIYSPRCLRMFSFLFSREVFEEENKKHNKYGYCNYEK